MRIACLQYAPQLGKVDANLDRANAVLSSAGIEEQEIDLLVLPELALTGYNFKSLDEIEPFLEWRESGFTSQWARERAQRYRCHVAGYPEKVGSPHGPLAGSQRFNSAIIVDNRGLLVGNYRKSSLYYTDMTWATEGGSGFFSGSLPGLGSVSLEICMDLKFEADWNDFEFAQHVLQTGANLVILSMAWLSRADPEEFASTPSAPDMDTLTYWMASLEPLVLASNQHERIVIFCNRSGMEGDALYAGSSTIIGIQAGQVKVYGMLGRGEENVLVVDTGNPTCVSLSDSPE